MGELENQGPSHPFRRRDQRQKARRSVRLARAHKTWRRLFHFEYPRSGRGPFRSALRLPSALSYLILA
jgi:hypothetical protein